VPTIIEVDPHDDATLRDFWESEQEAVLADREHPVTRTWEALRNSVRDPSAYHGSTLLAAVDGGRVVGGADVGMPLQDNLHLGELEINVRPGHRRRQIGTALYAAAETRFREAGRTTLLGEVNVPVSGPRTAGMPFAESLGFASDHVEDHFVLDLPVGGDQVRSLRASLPDLDGYDLVEWGDRCPDEHLDAYCAMRTQMDADLPIDDLDVEPTVYDAARVRTSEERLARSYIQLHVAARRRLDGVFGGFSIVVLPRGGALAWQLDTLVMPEHRGHRLGLLMKLSTLDRIHAEHPDRSIMHTWSAVSNAPMQATNRRFGYRAVERMHDMQRRLP